MKTKKSKYPGLGTFLKEAWGLMIERGKIHKALRLMNKQEWSVEFLTALLHRAARMYSTSLEMEIVSPNGARIVVRSGEPNNTQYKDDDILQHLDDEVKVNQFINMMQRKRNE
jgi:hydroxymethylpyrimidine pyrophosphatase-like HAD family hydrolase